MNWKCDLYCYEHVAGGWTTHVAGRRRVSEPPSDRFADFIAKKITAEEYVELHRATMDALGTIPLVDIDLPHAGETFDDPTLEAFKERLLELRRIGYVFPDHVLTTIDAEIKERADGQVH